MQGGAGINIMDLGVVGRVSRNATKYFLTCTKYFVKYTLFELIFVVNDVRPSI